jgi:predicted nucleic acid-binding protein
MNVVDSSCWIEYFNDTAIGNEVAPIAENFSLLIVPTIVLYEVRKKLLTESDDLFKIGEAVRLMQLGNVIVLDSELCIKATDVSRQYQLAMADSIIYATTILYDAVLWTADRHFKDFPKVQYFDKTRH